MRRTLFSLVLALAATPALAGGVMHYADKAALPAGGEEREVAALFDTWNAALATGNPHKVADLYAPDGVLLPTVSNEVRASREQIENYFEMFLTKKPKGVINYRTVRVLDDDSAVDAGVYTFTLTDKGVRASREQIENYFEMFLTKKPKGVINYRTVRVLDDDSAVDAGVYTFTLTDKSGKKSDVQARYTFVYEKRDGKWLIINHHSSAMPEVDTRAAVAKTK
ncbi:SgcJ/EcaC family oxidoreductase [Xanthomonas arboricola]|uniref:SgcJ/EcaC family oxidoreductase n=2 Tax=Xanthomonas TaxID=338 RepID=UPI0013796ED6|nr:SgcJ/EcaC family oxidoreductase [Xanthomonas arboricola]